MKYYFIMLLSIILSLSCYSKGLNLKLEIERNYEIDIGSISKESIFKGVKESKKRNISLECTDNICKIYESNNKIIEKKISKNEEKLLKKMFTVLKSKKNRKHIATNTIVSFSDLNGHNIELQYIPIEIEKIFDIFSYKNKVIITDENFFKTEKFSYEILNNYGNIWKLYCESQNCRIFYFSNNNNWNLTQEWNFNLSQLEVDVLKKSLIKLFIEKKDEEEINSNSRQEIIFDNGKIYNKTINSDYKKIIKETFNINIEKIENEN